MSVLITNDLHTFEQNSNSFRIVVFNKVGDKPSVAASLNQIREKNALRIRKGTLRVNNGNFDNNALYPPKFNNYNIVLRAIEGNGSLFGNVQAILDKLTTLNKNGTITIKNWENVMNHNTKTLIGRPSKFKALFEQYNATSTNQQEAGGSINKIIKI